MCACLSLCCQKKFFLQNVDESFVLLYVLSLVLQARRYIEKWVRGKQAIRIQRIYRVFQSRKQSAIRYLKDAREGEKQVK